MLPKVSLLDEIKKGGYEASLIATYNAYLPFYEEVVLRRLVNAGVRHNVLLMDARQHIAALGFHPPFLAGRSYTLWPVRVPGAFHPKLIFLAGKNKAALIVGSHNLTLSGFGFNRELTNIVRIDPNGDASGVALARRLWDEIDHWIQTFGSDTPQHVLDMVRRVQEFVPWLSRVELASDDTTRLLGARPGGKKLWDQLIELADDREVADVSIAGAFFDSDLRFLRTVQRDLKPRTLTIAVDPKTVKLPSEASRLHDFKFVHAGALGDDEVGHLRHKYLHAKAILIQSPRDRSVFVSGSANPSDPAWQASAATGNVELILAYRGDAALAAARSLGIDQIPNLPELSQGDWNAIDQNWRDRDTAGLVDQVRAGIALVDEGRILISASLLKGCSNPEFVVRGVQQIELARTSETEVTDQGTVVVCDPFAIRKAIEVQVLSAERLILRLTLHHKLDVEELARTGVQRQFKEALLSLDTNTPNISLLIQCIERIVFADEKSQQQELMRPRATDNAVDATPAGAPDTLAINAQDMTQGRKKRRLTHANDFSYLLDTLIYHLRIESERNLESLDRHGRSEEEQVGSDDESDDTTPHLPDEERDALMQKCHGKIKVIVNRMSRHLEAFSRGEGRLSDVIVRLLAVLAVLREFRNCDGKVSWVRRGETTVPVKQRQHLIEAVMYALFEPCDHEKNASLLRLDPIGKAIDESDDVARLKGLLLWLAWDSGLNFDANPNNVSREHLDNQLVRNAMMLALAQIVRGDETVIEEARRSIGSQSAAGLEWLKMVVDLGTQCDSMATDTSDLQPGQSAELNFIARHKVHADFGLRLVVARNSNRVTLARLNHEKRLLKFAPEHLLVSAPRIVAAVAIG